MAITDTINSMKTNIRNAYNSLSSKGATIPSKKNLANLKSTIDSIQTGGSSHPAYCFVVDQWYSSTSKHPKIITVYGGTAIDAAFFCNYSTSQGTWIRVTKITLPETITTIGAYAFRYCNALIELNLPDKITTINSYAFQGCSVLELEKLPTSLKTIGNYGFYDCRKITISELPSNLTSIGTYAFQNCYLMTIKEIPSGVTNITTSAFRNCRGLTEVTVKGAVTTIGTYAFAGCTALTKLSFPNIKTVPTLSGTNAFPTNIETIEVPSSLVNSIKSATNWSSFADIIVGI